MLAPATGGTATAIAQAQAAEAAGADGLLLLPAVPHRGRSGRSRRARLGRLPQHHLGVTVYSRANAILDDVTVAELADRNPNLVWLKDGVGQHRA